MLRLTAKELFDHMPDGVIVLERDWRITYRNKAAVAALGGHAIEGRSLWDAFPSARATKIEDTYRLAFETGASETCEFFSHDVGAWFEVRAVPVGEQLAVLFCDVSERRATLDRAETRSRALDALFDQVFLGIMQNGRPTAAHPRQRPFMHASRPVAIRGAEPAT